jgi:hypothetical protein
MRSRPTEMTNQGNRDPRTTRTIGLIDLILLCIVFYAGLTPFRAPSNGVSWVSNANALRFGHHGTIVSTGPFPVNGSSNEGHSLEVWMQPGRVEDDNTLLAFYDPKEFRGFGLHQSLSDLELRIESSSAWYASKPARMYVDAAFRDGETRVWAATMRPSGTAIYRDGVKVKESAGFVVSNSEFSGQLVVGTSPIFNDGWSGVLHGLAIYNRGLTADQIVRHYKSWKQRGRLEVSTDDACVALYLFDERAGRLAHNKVGAGNDLRIPVKYLVVHQTVIDPIWRAFNWSWGFWKDALINVIGFIPLGFFFCAYWAAQGLGRPALTASVLCGTISLFIELAQVLLPTRDSSMSDLIANTVGSIIGAVLYQGRVGQVVDRLIDRTNPLAPDLPSR